MEDKKEIMFQFVTEKRQLEKLREELIAEYNDLVFTKEEAAEEVEKEIHTVNNGINRLSTEIRIIKNSTPEATLKEWGREYNSKK